MEFTGRVKKILPLRSGVSAKTGNEWKQLPFIFEYFENPTDRYADTVLLETFDTKVIDNLKEGMEIRCGFGHRTREYEGKVYNELRLYKIESVKAANQAPQAANAPANAQASVAQPIAPQTAANQPQNDEKGGNGDDLPF